MQFPSHPISLDGEGFLGCSDLREIRFPDWVEEIPDGFLSANEHLTRVWLPDHLRRIGEGAFLLCENLAEIDFPDTLENIDNVAFYGTGLQQVILPEATESVGQAAFGSCPHLFHIEVNSPAVSGDPFFLSDPETGGEVLLGDEAPCQIREGYLAKGIPDDPEDLCWKWYALLWATDPNRHSAEVGKTITGWVSRNEQLLMELVFRQENTAALRTLVERHCLAEENLETYRARALKIGNPELTALLLDAEEPTNTVNLEEEFAL